jgi:hypothetical protein
MGAVAGADRDEGRCSAPVQVRLGAGVRIQLQAGPPHGRWVTVGQHLSTNIIRVVEVELRLLTLYRSRHGP